MKTNSLKLINKVFVAFRWDDFSATTDITTDKCIMSLFDKYGITQTIGVIPDVTTDSHDKNNSQFHLLGNNQEKFRLLKEWQARGQVEIALHGYHHQTNGLLTPAQGFSEFKGLSYTDQLQILNKGKKLLEEWYKVPINTFIPPWNSQDGNTVKAANALGFQVITGSPYDCSCYLPGKEICYIPSTTELKNFRSALLLVHKFFKFHNTPVFIVAIYHSYEFNQPADFSLLEDILARAKELKDVQTVTLSQLKGKLGESFQFTPAIRKARFKIQTAAKILSLIKKENFLILPEGFEVIISDYYSVNGNRADLISSAFFLLIFSLSILLIFIYSILLKNEVLNRNFTIFLILTLAFLFCSTVGFFKSFGICPKFGLTRVVSLFFFGILLTGFTIAYLLN